jgi:hypothetical protein
MRRRRRGHLYRGRGTRARELREFERRYPGRGARVYGATIQKVAEERAAQRPGGELREYVRPTTATSKRGRRFRRRGHYVEIVAHPHGKGEHAGRCTRACRRGLVGHPHRRRRRR